ncbi:ubiquitin carboxyl-terminal hydrolase 32-like isoform X1 [Dendroctonus ponderosae]|uniref:ubiquitinyl hydrolase 1 n=1 Tax=Dendroctonus ponderosae TaxID=77166 RepID=A0AAR5Q8L1_DENPD|nr:ubiquitin carboxyl-terminal hydrolase 32 isoform X1 [Dendroctonus ponderosae]XP_048521800.1 ubiquitin carboxyl-terminal hydrolase 32-like isoform X1 [Dendroctonus ponderosae]XP_048522107.1 ubiquitin carboxyl-terminal hydrolase 32-like isoform X1 [Dendroctonus ponderosae]
MGAKDSKRACLSYEDAVKRMSDAELKRVSEAFKRLTNGVTLLSQAAFAQHVLGEGVPPPIVEKLYTACGGGARGIALRDLICGLVLLTKGSQDEKIKFLWSLYCNDSGTHITRSEFQMALQVEGTLPPPDGGTSKPNTNWDRMLLSLFGNGQDKVGFEDFKAWIKYNRDQTILSNWLLSNTCVSLSSEVETPTFYQTLAGVTHLEEQDICELEKCFWSIQSSSITGHLDFNCLLSLVCPPVPAKACPGLFLALDVNRDAHIDFKELCCGISAACRGPMAERMKFCFKIFDMDRDLYLNSEELESMKQTLQFIANENKLTFSSQFYLEQPSTNLELDASHCKALESLYKKLDDKNGLTQEDFLMWAVEDNSLVAPLLELLFQVCHVSLGLKPHCRHNEYEIVMGWLGREERRGYREGQFWYLIASDWWQQWQNYTSAPRTNLDHCQCRTEPRGIVEEGIVCDESLVSNATDYPLHSNEFHSNSMESMGDLLSRGDSCSIASSSGVSSSSGTASKRGLAPPGPIDNSSLVSDCTLKVQTLTGEGGRLKRNTPLAQHHDFELVPDSLWKALAMWYGGPLPLPRQVIDPPGRSEVELELYPLNLRILRHQVQQPINNPSTWSSVVGGYHDPCSIRRKIASSVVDVCFNSLSKLHENSVKALISYLSYGALTTAGLPPSSPSACIRRNLAHVAAFSRLATIQQVTDFLCERLGIKNEDARLWLLRDHQQPFLLEDERAHLQDLGIKDADQILLEVRNKDLTWPEELGQLAAGGSNETTLAERRPTIYLPPGATGLHNLGNTCFMNAALQAVSNTRPLTMYFQQDNQLSELNSNNPDSTKGAVAKKYAELCRELWAGSTRSVAPLKIRVCVTKYAQHLSGGGQHDAQELLAWLLDALHEDLNRVPKKQYIEQKDSDGRPDEVVADEAWQYHLKRENSIVTDLFHGQLKSKVTCKTCGHESVKFDPFNHLSLPLPMESYTLCEVLVVRLNGHSPIKYGLRLNSEAKYGDLKEQLSQLCEVEDHRLLLAEVACCQIRSLLPDENRINPNTALELYAYELPADFRKSDLEGEQGETDEGDVDTEASTGATDSPLARSPEVRSGSAICMPNILCFKTKRTPSLSKAIPFKRSTISIQSNQSSYSAPFDASMLRKPPSYLIAVHRKCVRQDTYFLSQQKSKPSLFGMPLLLGCSSSSTCRDLYDLVWEQVTRLLSPMPQSDQTNHATDCDDSLGYEFPFTLKAVLAGGQICAICHWTKFCRGCPLPCTDDPLFHKCGGPVNGQAMHIAIDWDPTALHLRYQTSREKLWTEDESVARCRKLHTEPIDLDYCLKAFTSEENLQEKYHCSRCKDKQPATKKLQIWRLPPILIIHLKRFDCVNTKWVKTQKVVNFPFKDFNPTAYLASVPQETILRHRQILDEKRRKEEDEENRHDDKILEDVSEASSSSPRISTDETGQLPNSIDAAANSLNISQCDIPSNNNQSADRPVSNKQCEDSDRSNGVSCKGEQCKLLQCGKEGSDGCVSVGTCQGKDEVDRVAASTPKQRPERTNKVRSRLISTSLIKTPIIDENLKDYHEHKLLEGQDPFDLKYQLYAVVSHSGMLNGGHYISYACNPNGNWYCYNDSSCREVITEPDVSRSRLSVSSKNSSGCTPLSRRRNIQGCQPQRKGSTGSTDSDRTAPLATMDTSIASSASALDSGNASDSCERSSVTGGSKPTNSPCPSRLSTSGSTNSVNSNSNGFKCPYNNAKIPRIDTSSAYILFYERSGLDYKPYLPKVVPSGNGNSQQSAVDDADDCDSDLQPGRSLPERSPVLKWIRDKFST